MSTTRQQPPGDLGPERDSAGPASTVSADGRIRTLSLQSASGIVPLARDFTRQALYDWAWLPAASADRRAAAEDVLLVVSELVTNACLHAEGPEELRVSYGPKVLRLEVSDRGAGQPAPRSPHRAAAPAGTACSSSSGSVWTGESSVRRAGPARWSGRSWPRPPEGGTARTAVRTTGARERLSSRCPPLLSRIPQSAPIRCALCLPSARPRAYLERPI